MPQASYAFAVGRTRVLETRMLDQTRLMRMKEADGNEALKLLQESGYGQGVHPVDGDVEPMIKAELEAARKTVWEMTPAPDVTGLFLLHTDAHNLKALLKARLLDKEPEELLLEGGLFSVEKLKKAVEDKDYRDLPEIIKEGLNQMEKALAAHPDPRLLSAAVDRAAFDYAAAVLGKNRKRSNAFAREYFAADADFTNVQSVLRARRLGWGADKLAPMLVAGGDIDKKTLLEALDTPAEQLSRKLGTGRRGRAVMQAVEESAGGGHGAIERARDKALMDFIRSGKGETFGLGPVVGYLLGREAEARAIRLIFAAKRAGTAVELPELYV